MAAHISRTYRLNRLLSNTCIATSITVYTAWNYSTKGPIYTFLQQTLPSTSSSSPLPDPLPIRTTLTKYFLLKTSDPTNYASWIGSAFSHKDLYHIVFNLVTWSSFAPTLYMLPTYHFATLVFGSAAASAGTWLFEQRRRLPQQPPPSPSSNNSLTPNINRNTSISNNRSALGASGIVSALLATVTMFAPTARVAIMGIVPAPLWMTFGAYVLVDTYMMQPVGAGRSESTIGHSAHLGGAVFGVLYYSVFLRRFGGILGRR